MTIKKTVAATEEKSKGGFKERRKECLTSANKIPTVDIKGKKYSTVNERHRHLLQYFPEARFNEEILFHDNERVVVKTELYISDTIYAVGHAEEHRNANLQQAECMAHKFGEGILAQRHRQVSTTFGMARGRLHLRRLCGTRDRQTHGQKQAYEKTRGMRRI